VEWEYAPRQVADLLAEGEIQLVDVRERYEFEAGHVTGADPIALGELSSRADELDANLPLVFYCRSGARSGMATQAFRRAGFDAYNMRGGLLEWQASNLPLDPPDGYVAES
jgi:rhodanese-related sulfurtransferase